MKYELLQPSAKNDPDHYSERLMNHLKKQIVFLLDELEEKDQLIRSLLEQLPKRNDGIKISQEL